MVNQDTVDNKIKNLKGELESMKKVLENNTLKIKEKLRMQDDRLRRNKKRLETSEDKLRKPIKKKKKKSSENVIS